MNIVPLRRGKGEVGGKYKADVSRTYCFTEQPAHYLHGSTGPNRPQKTQTFFHTSLLSLTIQPLSPKRLRLSTEAAPGVLLLHTPACRLRCSVLALKHTRDLQTRYTSAYGSWRAQAAKSALQNLNTNSHFHLTALQQKSLLKMIKWLKHNKKIREDSFQSVQEFKPILRDVFSYFFAWSLSVVLQRKPDSHGHERGLVICLRGCRPVVADRAGMYAARSLSVKLVTSNQLALGKSNGSSK